MGSNSTQGLGILLFLVAFACLSGSLFFGGSILLALVFVVALAASIGALLKAKPLEHADQ